MQRDDVLEMLKRIDDHDARNVIRGDKTLLTGTLHAKLPLTLSPFVRHRLACKTHVGGATKVKLRDP